MRQRSSAMRGVKFQTSLLPLANVSSALAAIWLREIEIYTIAMLKDYD